MKMKLLNTVVFAEEYEKLVQWYKDAFSLEIMLQENGDYHYTELGFDSKIIVGITPAKEVEHQLSKPRNNASVMQIEVSDIKKLFEQVQENGGKVLFGPDFEVQNKFYYGGITDIEGNQIWVIEACS